MLDKTVESEKDKKKVASALKRFKELSESLQLKDKIKQANLLIEFFRIERHVSFAEGKSEVP
jgi:hypothetical protein